MAASVVGDHAVALGGEEEHLGIPVVAVEGPAVGEDYGLAGWVAPVFVEDLGAVGGGYEGHLGFLCLI